MSNDDEARRTVRAARMTGSFSLPVVTMARLDRLRVVTGARSRSHVLEMACDGRGLDALEREWKYGLERFARLAAKTGQGWQEYAALYGEIYQRQIGPDLGELEKMAAEGRVLGQD